jgi:ABC-type transporter Mla subunit MlaD
MPRAAAQRRRPTESDLNDAQREIYDALSSELREKFMRQLPDIAISSAQARKKAQLIRERVHLLERVISDLQGHRSHLNQLAKELDQGASSPETVDLRQELKPPSISGVALRFVRGRRG